MKIRSLWGEDRYVPVLGTTVPADGVVDIPDDLGEGFLAQTGRWAPEDKAGHDLVDSLAAATPGPSEPQPPTPDLTDFLARTTGMTASGDDTPAPVENPGGE